MKRVHILIAAFASAFVPPIFWYLAILTQSVAEFERTKEIGGEPLGIFILLAPMLFVTSMVFSYFFLRHKELLGRLNLSGLIKAWIIFFGPLGFIMALDAKDILVFFLWLATCILTPTVAWGCLKFNGIGRIR